MASDEMLDKLIAKLNIAYDEMTVRLYDSQSRALRNLLISTGADPEDEAEFNKRKQELINFFTEVVSAKMFNVVKAAYRNEFSDEEIEKLLLIMDDPLYNKFKAVSQKIPLKIMESLIQQFDRIFGESFKQFKEQIRQNYNAGKEAPIVH